MQALALHTFHERNSARFATYQNREMVRDYGDGRAEYAAARDHAALFDFSYRETLRVSGADRVSFLQGMLTNDVASIPVNGSTYAVLLTPKGAMVADARVLKRSDDLLLEVEPGLGAVVQATLQRYVVSEEVEISDASSDFGLLAVAGPESGALIAAALPPFEGAIAQLPEGTLWRVPEEPMGPTWQRLIVPAEIRLQVTERLDSDLPAGSQWAGFDAYEVLRVEAGMPRYGIDCDEHTIPLEANLQRAISYDKGCYIGQEVIARTTYRGHVNRKLCGVTLDAGLPPPCAELSSNGKVVGSITSAVHSPSLHQAIALAYVHRESSAPGTRLNVAEYAGAALVHPLPFVGS